MNMSFGLGVKLATSQKLTPQMQQAIKLLQMSSLELAQEVQLKLDSNPMLEREEANEDALDFAEDFADEMDFEQSDKNSDEHADGYEDGYKDSYEDGYADSHTEGYQNGHQDSNQDHGWDDPADNTDGSDPQSQLLERYQDTDTDHRQRQRHDSDSSDYHDTGDTGKDDYGSDAVDSLSKLEQSSFDTTVVDTDWDNVYSHDSTAMARPDYDELDDYQGSTSSSIQDHVRWQLNLKHLSDTDKLIADYLIDAMDDMGYIHIDLDELRHSFETFASFYQWQQRIEADEITAVLHMIQACEPTGVGARSLSECLELQLKQLPTSTPFYQQAHALLHASKHLVSNNIKALLAETGMNREEIQPAIDLLRSLCPAPGEAFARTQLSQDWLPESYDIPDVLVSAVASSQSAAGDVTTEMAVDAAIQHWQVRLNPDTLPKLRINQEYANLVKRGDDSPDNLYLKEHLTDARLFIRSIEERNQNLLKVATCIVQRQQAFLLHGATAMQPMILKDVADSVGLHESTVSRLTTSKSMLTPQGLFAMKYFFSSHVAGTDGEVSSTAISAMIEQMISEENPKKPLSDNAIMQRLQQDGIDIARRTVAKYREAMNIGSSTQRKQKY